MNLSNKVALVTGSAKRVGRQIAVALARKGCRIAIHFNRSRAEACKLARELEEKYRVPSSVFQAELGDLRQVRRMTSQVLRRFGRIDILVNSASVYERTPFGKTTEAEWDNHLNVNLRAPFFLAQELGRDMKKQGGGKIVNIADWAGLRPYRHYLAYCVSKAGLIALTQGLAKELSPEVQVNAVLPGPVMLPPGLSRKETEAIVQATLVKRLGSPEDVANAVVFLVEGSDFITGVSLPVDGGRLIN